MELIQKNEELRENNMILTLSTNNNIHGSIRSLEETSENYNANTEAFNNPNEVIINNERTYRTNGPVFIIKCYPNKFSSILTLFLNLMQLEQYV